MELEERFAEAESAEWNRLTPQEEKAVRQYVG